MKRENKRTRRALLIAVLALVVCVATIGGTVAWLTDTTDEVKNTFSPSNIDITLTETKPTDYKAKMIPGSEIDKDPVVTVLNGSEASWLFVKVDDSWTKTVGEGEDAVTYVLDDFLDYSVDETKWTALDAINFPGIYYLEDAGTLGEDATATYRILTNNKVTVKNTVTKEMMNALGTSEEGFPKLIFKAAAVQKANIAAVNTAWEQVRAELGYPVTP